jgi:hypothetical protein
MSGEASLTCIGNLLQRASGLGTTPHALSFIWTPARRR